MDDSHAIYGGREATVWQKRPPHFRSVIARNKAKRAEYDARCKKVERAQRRKARVEKVERVERAAWLKARHGEGYRNPNVPYKDITGMRFGRLIAVRPRGRRGRNKKFWMQCDCGSLLKEVAVTNLKQGHVQSCGCLKREALRRSGSMAMAPAGSSPSMIVCCSVTLGETCLPSLKVFTSTILRWAFWNASAKVGLLSMASYTA